MDKLQNKKIFYRVKQYDSVIDIARKFNVNVFDLIEDNRLTREVRAGDVLIINFTNCVLYKVGVSDNLDNLSQKFNIAIDTLRINNGGIPYVFYGLEIKV